MRPWCKSPSLRYHQKVQPIDRMIHGLDIGGRVGVGRWVGSGRGIGIWSGCGNESETSGGSDSE